MILPPFFGIASKYDEAAIRQAIVTYLSSDIITYTNPSSIANVTFASLDTITYSQPLADVSVTYSSLDVVTAKNPSVVAAVTYGICDICTYDPPPEPPEITVFISGLAEDSSVELSWTTPYNNRCDITNYILEYTDCFLSNILTENNIKIITDNTDALITDNYRINCNYQEFDKSRLLLQDLDRLATSLDNLIITEQSSGVGLTNFSVVDELYNGQSYIFRVAAVNCAGTGLFGYSDIFTPIGPNHKYCDILAFLQPDSTTDIYASLTEHSCREKEANHIAGVTVSPVSKFGTASLYFDAILENSPTPPTYSHLQIDHKYSSTLDDWSLVDDFSIELWIRPDTFPYYANQTLVSSYYQNNYNTYENYNNRYWKLYLNGTSLRFQIYNENYDAIDYFYSEVSLSANNLTISTTEFTHIAVCRFDNYIRLYVNGVRYDRKYFDKNIIIPQDNNPYVIIAANQTDSYIDSDEFNTGRGAVNEPFKGYIDDIMISKSARYAKNFIPAKYTEPAYCQDCGGYITYAAITTIDDNFIP
jgi:hypothetical protein